MKKYKYIYVVLGISIFICIGFVFFANNRISQLSKKIVEQKLSAKEIDSYLESNPSSVVVNEQAEESFNVSYNATIDSKYVYTSAEGITMLSNSDHWQEDKLKALYEELIQNEHGEEMNTLYKVYIHGEANTDFAGTHGNDSETITFKINFPAIPSVCDITFVQNMGTINLYNGDVDNTVESQAMILSHEYGHHYTFYHMLNDDEDDLHSEYASIRDLPKDKVLISRMDYDFYKQNHHWYLQEIAADDYVQLMGSPNARRTSNYIDVNDVLHNKSQPAFYTAINGFPQENLFIPLAFEIEGLYDYFHSFIDGGSREKPIQHEKLPIHINIQERTKSHTLETGPVTYVYYEVTWNQPYTIDGIKYTLVCYDPDNYDYPFPIKTVNGNETPLAYMGTVSYETTTLIYWQYDTISNGTKAFIVTATFPDGTVFKSEPVEYTFR